MSNTLNEYQQRALSFANHEMAPETAIAVWALGLCGESGETADHIKKWIGHGHELDLDKVEKELGDVLWYVSTLADSLGLTLQDIADRNIEKLTARYGDSFSQEKSRNRAA